LGAALGDAAWMTGMERNSDLVVMASYAPLFVNVNPGGMQWQSDLIGYDAMSSYGAPSFYAQSMFAQYLRERGANVFEPGRIVTLFLFGHAGRWARQGVSQVGERLLQSATG